MLKFEHAKLDRAPIQNLFDYIEGGETLTDFLKGFDARESGIFTLKPVTT